MKITFPPTIKAWLVDAGERVGSSFAEAVIAACLAGALAKGVNASTVHVLLIAGLTAAGSTLKALIAPLVKRRSVSPASLVRLKPPRPSTIHDRLEQLPPTSGRKGGALPSPRDDRDYKAKLPPTIPVSCNYGAGIRFGMLLNDRISDCYPAALLHALQVITGGKYAPTDADVLAVYEAMGYDPKRVDGNGNNPTDRGTVGRVLFGWAKTHGLITSYAAVPVDRQSIKAAIAGHKAVLCEWALPAGAETEGAAWAMPRSGRAAGSWGGHATVEVGYTRERNDNVTWGEEGTVTPSFEDAYLQAAWVIETPAVIPPIRH